MDERPTIPAGLEAKAEAQSQVTEVQLRTFLALAFAALDASTVLDGTQQPLAFYRDLADGMMVSLKDSGFTVTYTPKDQPSASS